MHMMLKNMTDRYRLALSKSSLGSLGNVVDTMNATNAVCGHDVGTVGGWTGSIKEVKGRDARVTSQRTFFSVLGTPVGMA